MGENAKNCKVNEKMLKNIIPYKTRKNKTRKTTSGGSGSLIALSSELYRLSLIRLGITKLYRLSLIWLRYTKMWPTKAGPLYSESSTKVGPLLSVLYSLYPQAATVSFGNGVPDFNN